MRKISLLTLLVILTNRAYASSGSENFLLEMFLRMLNDRGTEIPANMRNIILNSNTNNEEENETELPNNSGGTSRANNETANNFYSKRTFADDNGTTTEALISPRFLLGIDILQSNRIDLARYPENNAVLLRVPLYVFEGINFPQNMIRNQPVGQLVFLENLNRNSYMLRNEVINIISSNNDVQYRNPISIYRDESNPENILAEILLRNNVQITEEATTTIREIENRLYKYRPDIVEKLRSQNFFRYEK